MKTTFLQFILTFPPENNCHSSVSFESITALKFTRISALPSLWLMLYLFNPLNSVFSVQSCHFPSPNENLLVHHCPIQLETAFLPVTLFPPHHLIFQYFGHRQTSIFFYPSIYPEFNVPREQRQINLSVFMLFPITSETIIIITVRLLVLRSWVTPQSPSSSVFYFIVVPIPNVSCAVNSSLIHSSPIILST